MAKKAQATVTISAQNKLKAGIQDATKELGNFSKVVDKIGKLTIGAGIGAALYEIGKAAKYCIDEFEKIEPVQRRLTAALGQGTKAYESAQNTIAKYSKQTLQAGDDVTALVAKLAQLGKSANEIDDITHACVALSNVTGNDLNSSLGNLLDSLNGEVGELKKFIPELTNMSKEALKAGNGIQYVIDKFGKLSEEVSKDSFSQTQKNIEDSWSTTSQSIGQILKNDLQGVMDWWAKKSEEIANTFSAMVEHSENQKILSGIKNNYITPEKSHDEYQRGHVIDQEATVKDGIIQAFNGVPTDVLTAELTRIASEYARNNRGADYEYSAEDKLWTETIKKVLWQRNAVSSKRDDPTSPYGAVELGGVIVDGAQAAKDGKKAQIEAARASKEASDKLTKSAQDLVEQYSKYLAPRTDEEKIDALVDERNTLDSKLQELIKDGKEDSEEAASIRRIIEGIDDDIDVLNLNIVNRLQKEEDERLRLAKEEEDHQRTLMQDAGKKAEDLLNSINFGPNQIVSNFKNRTQPPLLSSNQTENIENATNALEPYLNYVQLSVEDQANQLQIGRKELERQLTSLEKSGQSNTIIYKSIESAVKNIEKKENELRGNTKIGSMLKDSLGESWQNINSDASSKLGIVSDLTSSLEELFQAVQPIVDMCLNPWWKMLVEVTKGFVEVIAPAINDTIKPFFEALNGIGRYLGQMFMPIFEALYPYVQLLAQILETSILPVLDLIAPFLDIVAYILDMLRPILTGVAIAFEYLMSPVKWLGDLFKWIGDWIKYAGHCIDVAFYNLAHPFRKKEFGDSPGAFKSDAFSGLDERIAKIVDTGYNSGSLESSSTGTAVQNASYTGGTTVHINIYQQAPVVGEGGMDEFVTMIKEKFIEFGYAGR